MCIRDSCNTVGQITTARQWPGTAKERPRRDWLITKDVPELTAQSKQSILLNSPRGMQTSTPMSNGDEKLCCVCYCAEPDGVFLECGHGGLCFECALGIWEKVDECYLCRSPIQQVIQLDIEALNSARVVKVKACTRLETSPERRGYFPDTVETH
eukprot:TRINITY_DN10732_c0_g1_i3.p1 TRINITY_DN10732_c0_g1~~TRINITY_DN10732_c0_g1_i3.p1  ORF type:complete len:155 (+),score=20.21 TRINITY_DN10732_c0_g1_i3:64-528(+)